MIIGIIAGFARVMMVADCFRWTKSADYESGGRRFESFRARHLATNRAGGSRYTATR
jgi:hypothetical protein